MILFTYSNPLLNVEWSCSAIKPLTAGASGLVVPIFPLEEAERLSPLAAERGLDLVLLVAPTTPPQRMERIALKSRVSYLVSVARVTGGVPRWKPEWRIGTSAQAIIACTAVGFGISGAEQVKRVRGWGADGAIVGSALVKEWLLRRRRCRKLKSFALICVRLPTDWLASR